MSRLRYTMLGAALSLPLTANAALIIDVTTTHLGGSAWQYSYELSGKTFDEDEGFSIFFDHTQYADLDNETAGGDWDLLIFQPDTDIPADGLFDALAIVNNASLLQPFSVEFTWLGPGTPSGVQAFETYRCDDVVCENLDVTGSGTTRPTAAVPAPATLSLLIAGLAAGVGVRTLSRKKQLAPKHT